MEIEEDTTEATFKATISPHKYSFKFKRQSGNLLTVHHTIRDTNRHIRIRLGVCCFSDTLFVAIDKRGNVFVFDLVRKKHWRVDLVVVKSNVIRHYNLSSSKFLVGTKLGQLLLLDVDQSRVLKSVSISNFAVDEISFAGQPLLPLHLALVQAGNKAILVNLDTFDATHRLDFDQLHISLKFACFLSNSEQLFTCFSNDSLHVWSSVTLNTLRVAYPIKARDRKLRLMSTNIPEFSLVSGKTSNYDDFQLHCQQYDYSNGLIISYCFPPDGPLFCLTTVDCYLLLLSSYTFELERIFRLRDFILKECKFLSKTRESLIFGISSAGQVLLLDCQNTELKMIVQSGHPSHLSISWDSKLLAVLSESGEADIWSTCWLYNTLKSQGQCMQMLKDAFKQRKPLAFGQTENEAEDCFNEEIKKLLNRERLLSILQEYGCYPLKYRGVIWCALLKLPCNRRQFQQLLKLGTPLTVRQRAQTVKLKNETLKRALVKIWSCLAHWCKVFAYCDFLPQLIFPFVKLFPKNILVTFEICATLVVNHFQLWFELHPLHPTNYLGMCDNLLQHFDSALCKFYADMDVTPVDYAWSLLSNALSEVLDEDQWLCLWDNILSCPTYLLLFCVIAYNILQREIVLRLPNKQTIKQFFHEQNPVDISKVITKALSLMRKCPDSLHPKRYMKHFQPIPKNVYPKFLNYPQDWVKQHEEELLTLQREQRSIDLRVRQLELEELQMIEHLENGLKHEEHAKRMKEMQKLYQDTLNREEQRIACQRKMLLVYQKEIRSRKGQVIATLRESDQRRKVLQMEKELDLVTNTIERERMQNDAKMIMAEEEIRNQEMEFHAQKHFSNTLATPLTLMYYDDVQRLCQERTLLNNSLKQIASQPIITNIVESKAGGNNLDEIERKIDDIQNEFMWLQTTN